MPNTDFVAVPNATPCPHCNKVHKNFPVYCLGKVNLFCRANCMYRAKRGWQHHKLCLFDEMLTYKLTQFIKIAKNMKVEKLPFEPKN